VPQHRTRAAAFDDLVLAALDRLTPVWGQSLAEVDPVVVDVPPPPTAGGAAERVPLGRAVPRSGTQRARLVLYRRPIELRAGDQLPALVHAVVVEQVAALLGQRPEQIDPHYED
jgi:predicted Zn-dependent protease with MMP-like domain